MNRSNATAPGSRKVAPFTAADLVIARGGALAVPANVLAARLGFRHSEPILAIINRNRDVLKDFGPIASGVAVPASARGGSSTEASVLLNKHQALVVIALSRVGMAERVARRVGSVFDRASNPTLAGHHAASPIGLAQPGGVPQGIAPPPIRDAGTPASVAPRVEGSHGVLYGRAAIATYLGVTPRQVSALVKTWRMPVSRAALEIWISRHALDEWVATSPGMAPAAPNKMETTCDAFIAARLVHDPHGVVQARVLYRAFRDYAAENGVEGMSETKFGLEMQRCIGRSVPHHIAGRRCNAYLGVRLVPVLGLKP